MDLSKILALPLPTQLNKPSVAACYLQLLVEIVTERGFSEAELFAGLPISARQLERSGERISPLQWGLAVRNAMQLCDDEGLGYECGLRMRPTVNGYLGYAVMSCKTVADAAELLAAKSVLADPQASQQAIEHCEREIAQLGGEADSVTVRVCAELVLTPHKGYPSQEQIASALHQSTRTLARQLRSEGTSFRELLDAARQRDACQLLESSPLGIADIAAYLGYRNPANFTRAFRQRTGQTPRQFLEELR